MRAIRKHYSSEEKIRIVLHGLRGEDSIVEVCRVKRFLKVGDSSMHCAASLFCSVP